MNLRRVLGDFVSFACRFAKRSLAPYLVLFPKKTSSFRGPRQKEKLLWSQDAAAERQKPRQNLGFLVGVTGLEPAASCSQSRRATNCATPRNIVIDNTGKQVRFPPKHSRPARLKRFALLLVLSPHRLALSATGGASAVRPTALHPEILLLIIPESRCASLQNIVALLA